MAQMVDAPITMAAGDKAEEASSLARFTALIEAQKRTFYKIAYVYCQDPDERQDLIQEIALQVWRALPQFDGRASEATWTYRLALNVAMLYRRREGRRLRDTVPIEVVINLSAADRAFERVAEDSRLLRTLIDGLDEMNRSLMLLYLDGFDHAEIAEMLGTSPSNVGTRLSRIRHQLKSQIT
jgi:RNA polymerase sigma-70 factor (ECF subfamily)